MLMGIGMLGMGVVATQHIREEYDEDDDGYDEEEDEEEYDDLDIVAEPEGGGPSSGALNTHGDNAGRSQMAVGEVVLNNINARGF
jgi:hypothetical protein